MRRVWFAAFVLCLGLGLEAQRIPGVGRFTLPRTTDPDLTCTQTISNTNTNLNTTATNAAAGSVICLENGTYNTGTTYTTGTKSPRVTIKSAPGHSATTSVTIGSGTIGLTFDSLTITGGGIDYTSGTGRTSITFSNSTFTTSNYVLDDLTAADANVLFENTIHNNSSRNAGCTDTPARIHVSGGSAGSGGVTIRGATMIGGDRDGVQTGSPVTIEYSIFGDIVEDGGSGDCQHTDPVQGVGSTGVVLTGNLVYDSADGFVDFDDVSNWTVTHNACYGSLRGSCITLYSDTNSVIEHNTAKPGDDLLELSKKAEHAAGTGTVFRNNVGTLSNDGQGVGTNTNNLFSGATGSNINGSPTFVGGANPTTWGGFKLAGGSAGKNAATDGTDVGITTGELAYWTPEPPTHPYVWAFSKARPVSLALSYLMWRETHKLHYPQLWGSR